MIKIPGILYFKFKITRALIDKLAQGRDIFTNSEGTETVQMTGLKFPVKELILIDPETVLLPDFKMELRTKLVLERDKRRKRR